MKFTTITVSSSTDGGRKKSLAPGFGQFFFKMWDYDISRCLSTVVNEESDVQLKIEKVRCQDGKPWEVRIQTSLFFISGLFFFVVVL